MHDALWSWSLLCGAAFLAGIVNSIAGGGTLLTFPCLLAVMASVPANATSTVALLPGAFASGWAYRREISRSGEHLMRLWPSSLIGGIVGSLLLIRLPEKVFAHLVPWLLVVAATLLLLQPFVVRWVKRHPHGKPTTGTIVVIILFQFLVGVYGGYFGAGIGILMLSSLAVVGITDIHQMNGVKNVLGATINGVTALIFAFSGIVVWKYALVMAIASIAGGYLGARTAKRMPVIWVRAIVVMIGFVVAAYSWFGK